MRAGARWDKKHPFRRSVSGLVVWLVAVAVLFVAQGGRGLIITENSRTFANWTHIADFAFTAGGRIQGVITSTSQSSWLVLFEESLWEDMRMRKDPEISTCDLKAMASWSVALESSTEAPKRIDFEVKEFGKYHAFVVDVKPPQCFETMQMLIKWRKTKTRGPVRIFHRLLSNSFHYWRNTPKAEAAPAIVAPSDPGFTTIHFDLHFINIPYGSLSEFSADDRMILPALCVFAVLFGFLVRFQLASTRLLWTNSGVPMASALLIVFLFKLGSILISAVGLCVFMLRGKELAGAHHYKVGSIQLDGLFGFGLILLLVLTAKGWMIATPSFSQSSDKSQYFLWAALAIHLLSNTFSVAELVFFDATSVSQLNDHYGMAVEIFLGCSHFYILVSSYADLVNIMLRSRKFPGAKLRGRVFSVVAAVLMTWGVAPVLQIAASHATPFWLEPLTVTVVTLSIQLFMSALFAWAFRPEVLWELHGERPHRSAAKLLTQGGPKHLDAEDDVIDEMDSLLL